MDTNFNFKNSWTPFKTSRKVLLHIKIFKSWWSTTSLKTLTWQLHAKVEIKTVVLLPFFWIKQTYASRYYRSVLTGGDTVKCINKLIDLANIGIQDCSGVVECLHILLKFITLNFRGFPFCNKGKWHCS